MNCSTKKNTFLSRNIHALSTEYNVLYNGNEALEAGKESLIMAYVDNYWELLSVERLKVDEDIILPEFKEKNPHFEKAEEKATKAIQKHGMNIDGREYNPQMDEAYLLLGKARYYDQRFIPALEAFNYVLYKYWTSDKVNETRIWREKVNIRLEYEELAIKNLNRMFRLEELSAQEYAEANATMAQAYINLGDKHSAIQRLKLAVSSTDTYEKRGRYYFIMGQLYNSLEHIDSAGYAFDKVIDLNRKTLRVYVINAHLEHLRNIDKDAISDEAFLSLISALEENYENYPFLDKIYREKAMFYAHRDSLELMEHYLNKSLRTDTRDRYLKSFNYEDLAQLRFDGALYKDAGAYYDSTLIHLKKDTKKYRTIEKKRKNLEEVIKYEDVAQKTDSILSLVAMDSAARQSYFENHIETLKAIEREKAADDLSKKKAAFNEAKITNSFVKSGDEKVRFYFYNPITLQYGRNEFKNIWGKRKLEDNWRFLDKKIFNIEEKDTTAPEAVAVKTVYDINQYLSKIPSDQNVIDSIHTERNVAYYQLGVLYKEKFREYGLAIDRLKTLLTYNPEERFVLLSKYHLYKIYELLQQPEAEAMKNNIIREHPNSRYATILKNPNTILYEASETPEQVYTSLFKAFENQEYEKVITQSDNYISQFNGEPIVPKFEMLKASAIGRLRGFEPYKKALNGLALSYPNDEEGKAADKLLKEQLHILEDKQFKDSISASNWKLIFPMERSDIERMEKLMGTITRSLQELNYDHLKVSKDIYDDDQAFIVVHGFKSEDYALGYAELLSINKDYRIRHKNFTISSQNYKIIQLHKNLKAYQKEKLKS